MSGVFYLWSIYNNMKYLITESKYNNVIKQFIETTFGDVEMNVDEDGYIHFFSVKDVDSDGHRFRFAHRNLYGTLFINYNFFHRMVKLFGPNVGDGIRAYFRDKFDLEIKSVNMEF